MRFVDLFNAISSGAPAAPAAVLADRSTLSLVWRGRPFVRLTAAGTLHYDLSTVWRAQPFAANAEAR